MSEQLKIESVEHLMTEVMTLVALSDEVVTRIYCGSPKTSVAAVESRFDEQRERLRSADYSALSARVPDSEAVELLRWIHENVDGEHGNEIRDCIQRLLAARVPHGDEPLMEAAWRVVTNELFRIPVDGAVLDRIRLGLLALARHAAAPVPSNPEEAEADDDDRCPTTGRMIEECRFCQGEACYKCGAGCWSDRNDCDHDVGERHEGWPYHPASAAAQSTGAQPESERE